MWGLLRWLYPQIFTPTTRTLFASSFDLAAGTYALPVLKAVRALLGTIQLRRTKNTLDSSALGGVPPKEEWTVFIPLTEAQRFWTYKLLTRLDQVDLEAIFPRSKTEAEQDVKMDDGRADVLKLLVNQAQGATTSKRVLSLFFLYILLTGTRVAEVLGTADAATADLRPVRAVSFCFFCALTRCSPYMIDDAMPEDYEIGEHIVAASSKLLAIDKILAEVLPKGQRVLIFSQWTGCARFVLSYLK